MSDPFDDLRRLTPARVGLGRAGSGLTTKTHLDFQFAHARARDAVHRQTDFDQLARDLAPLESCFLKSAAPDRATYLRRPDLGRKLAPDQNIKKISCDLAFVIADGLSSDAVQTHGACVVKAAHARLSDFSIAPIYLVSQARVAIGDEIAQKAGARLVVLLVGERPGLTVADSLGAYLTFAPEIGRLDSERNCISNIHNQGGLSVDQAVFKIDWLVREALRLGLSGTGLKENAMQALAQTPSKKILNAPD